MQDQQVGLTRLSGPTGLAVDLTEVKPWLRVVATDDDALITSIVKAATRRVEAAMDGTVLLSSWRMTMDFFPGQGEFWRQRGPLPQVQGAGLAAYRPAWLEVRLRRPPLVSVDAVRYVDTGGTLQTLSPSLYVADATSRAPRLAPAYGKVWPACRVQPASVQVDFTAGYADAASVPDDVKTAIKITAAWLYEFRGDGPTGKIPDAAAAMLDDFGSGTY